MNLAIKITVYVLLTSSFDNTSTIPILSRVQNSTINQTNEYALSKPSDNRIDKGLRPRRQDPVVQPTWTSDQQGIENLFQDFNVKVTEKKLVETEAIRLFIHNIVENGTFAVDLDESDFPEENKNSDQDSSPASEPEASADSEDEVNEEPESEAAPKPKAASESEVVPESSKSEDTPDVIPEPVAPSETEDAQKSNVTPAQPFPQAKSEQDSKNKHQPPTKTSNKSKKVANIESANQNHNKFFTWLQNIFMNPWSMF